MSGREGGKGKGERREGKGRGRMRIRGWEVFRGGWEEGGKKGLAVGSIRGG